MGFAKLKVSKEKIYTVDEYLEIERKAFERSEYIDGEIFAMAGESDAHGDISVNLTLEIGNQLKGKNCRVRTKDAKIKSGGFAQIVGKSTKGMFSSPDLVVVCGDVVYHDKKRILFSTRRLSSRFCLIRPAILIAAKNLRAIVCLMKL